MGKYTVQRITDYISYNQKSEDTKSAMSKSILEAIDAISQNSVRTSNAALTIEATITEIEDAGLGIYKVNYRDNSFSAQSSSKAYKVGDVVYVLVPEGDFSKPKMIIGSLANTPSTIVDEDVADYVILTDNNLLEDEEEVNQIFSLCSYRSIPIPEKGKKSELTFTLSQSFKEKLNNWIANKYRNLALSATIQTDIPPEQQEKGNKGCGNFGVIIKIPILRDLGDKEEEATKEIVLDINTFQGFPYSTGGKDVLQISLGQLEENESIDLSEDENKQVEVIIFVQDFPISSSDPNLSTDIIIKNIGLDVITFLTDEDKEGYFLSLVASEGPLFVEDSHEVKTLTPYLKINGKDSAIQDNYECYQFIEDNFIKNTSDKGYTDVAGFGQKCLNKIAEDGTYITNEYTLDIKRKDVYYISRYRCILVQDSMIISADIDIKETLGNQFFKLETSANSYLSGFANPDLTAYIEYEGKEEQIGEIPNITISYNRYNIDNTLVPDNIIVESDSEGCTFYGFAYTQQSYLPSDIDRLNTIRCTFRVQYKGQDEPITIGSTSAVIKIDNENVTLAIQEGDVLYKYDSAGNSPLLEVYTNSASAIEYITPLTFKLYKSDGSEFTEGEYEQCQYTQRVSKNSMLTFKGISPKEDGYYYIKSRTLQYGIADSFDPLKSNNLVTLTVTSKLLEKVLQDNVNIIFIKEGETGSNNSRYSGLITYGGFGYGQIDDNGNIQKLQILYSRASGNWQYSNIVNTQLTKYSGISFRDFGIKLYSKGKEVFENEKYSFDIHQKIFNKDKSNSILTVDEDNKIYINEDVFISTQDNQINNTTILMAEVEIKNNGITEEKVYLYYPVEFIVINIENIEEEEDVLKAIRIPHMAGGYDKVLYEANGYNPQYNSSDSFKIDNCIIELPKIDSTDPDIAIFNCSQSSGGVIEGEDEEGFSYTPAPSNSFLNKENSVNYVKTVARRTYGNKEQVDEKIALVSEEILLTNNDITNVNEFINNPESENSLNSFFEYKNTSFNTVKEVLTNTHSNQSDIIRQFLINRKDLLDLLHTIADNILDIKNCLHRYSLDNTQGTEILDQVQYCEKNIQTSVEKRDGYRQQLNLRIDFIDSYYKPDEAKELIKSLAPLNEEAQNEITELYNIFCNNATLFNQKAIDALNFMRNTTSGGRDPYEGKQNIIYGLVYERLFSLVNIITPSNLSQEAQNTFKNLVEFHIYVKSILQRLADPISDDEVYIEDITSQEEAHSICERKQNTPYPIYTECSDFISIIIPNIEGLIDNYKDYNYQVNAGNKLILKLQQKVESLEVLKKKYQELLVYFEYPQFTLLKPIIVLLDSHHLDINGQGENSLSVEGSKIEAASVGAGSVNNDGTFTGVTFGTKVTEEQSTRRSRAVEPTITTQRGLYSYNNGVESYCLNAEDGSTIIGTRNSGQVLADPSSRTLLYSSNYQKNYNVDGKPQSYEDDNRTENQKGILIDLTNSNIELTYQDPITEQQQTKSILDIASSGSDSRVDQLIEQVSRLTIQVQELQSQLSTVSAELNNRIPAHESDTETINIKFN